MSSTERSDVTLDTIVSLCKRRGFIFPGSEIYGGLGGTFDFGPLGAELKKNVKQAWWRAMIYERDDIEGLDASILMHPLVWKASGHVDGFSDPLADCLGACKKRYRIDHIDEQDVVDCKIHLVTGEDTPPQVLDVSFSAPNKKAAKAFVEAWWRRSLGMEQAKLKVEETEGSSRRARICPECGGTLSEPRNFNLMFKTQVGPVEDSAATVYLRPETAQGIFVNFANVQTTARRKVPFGIAQIGKSFRNEITPRNFIFRVREFEQMELEFFCKPGELCKPGEMTDVDWHNHWLETRFNWYLRYGIKKEHLRLRPHEKTELAHYARACSDVEFLFPIGWQELEGIANRTDFDLKQHSQHSGKDLSYFDPELNQRYIPYVIEPSAGVDRSTLAFLTDAYFEEEVKGEKRVVLRLHSDLAPVKAAVFPLLKNRPELVEMAHKLTMDLKKRMYAVYDDTAAIGKLYRRQDEIGTPFCVTVDVESLTDGAVTVRERDSMQQTRIAADKLTGFVTERLG